MEQANEILGLGSPHMQAAIEWIRTRFLIIVVTGELMSAKHGQQFPEKRMWLPALAVPPDEGLYEGLPV